MQVLDKVVVVTGGAHGIGRALCMRFAAEGAKAVVVADVDEKGAREVARCFPCGEAFGCDVASESDVAEVVDQTLKRLDRIDLFCSNAGIAIGGGCDAPNHDWVRSWQVNVMGHVYAARAVLPSMLARGEGYLLQTVSAAGLLSQIGSAPYSVTKHAALGLAEWLSITYGDKGIKVSALCPMGVRTDMLAKSDKRAHALLDDSVIDPDEVASVVIQGLAEEKFLILPHPQVQEFVQRKASDYDRWLAGMRRLQAKLE